MIITIRSGVDASAVRRALAGLGLWTVSFLDGSGPRQLLVRDGSARVPRSAIVTIPGVDDVSEPESRHPLVDALPPTVEVAGVRIGGDAPPLVMAGPCSVESEEAIHEAAGTLAPLGVRFLRGGAYKPRTSPYDFQGVGDEALRWLRDAARVHGLRVVTEALSEGSAERVAEHADLIQIGSRSMHASALLRAVGRTGRPVLLKRGMAATVEEWLSAGEYCLAQGAPAVVFCERGIRGFDSATRNLLDLGTVALFRHVLGLPVIVDPSHALGRRDLVLPLSRAALAAGASGLLLEVHDAPEAALSDGPQAVRSQDLAEIVSGLALPAGSARG